MSQPALFDAFNARFLAAEEVGKQFVYNSIFEQVILAQNSLLVGPRGSGKTTLLKMLTLPGLKSWKHQNRAKILKSVEHVAIYVPSDFTWFPDFRRPIDVNPEPELDSLFCYALFRAHVLRAICETISQLLDPELQADPLLKKFSWAPEEARVDKFVEVLAKQWKVSTSFGGLYALKLGISNQISGIQSLITRSAIERIDLKQALDSQPFLARSFFDDCRDFADIAEQFTGKRKWMLLFDELEIAPSPVKSQILQSPRSFDQRFLIKCSASPFDDEFAENFGPKMPMGGQDFREVKLSNMSLGEIQQFSRAMFAAICREHRLSAAKAEKVLGSSFFDDDFDADIPDAGSLDSMLGQSNSDRYAPGGFHYRKFSSLSNKDPSFRSYLDRRGISIEAMSHLPEKMKAAEIRKMISTVAVRDEFLFDKDGAYVSAGGRRRIIRATKRVSEIYTGARSAFAICEGNPRWLIGFLRPIVSYYASGEKTNRSGIVPRGEQARRIEVMTTQFLALLSTMAPSVRHGVKATPLNVVNEIGGYFFHQVLSEQFVPEPVLSLKVDEEADAATVAALGHALNQGAFVIIDSSKDQTPLGEVKGKRLRLTHLLAPLFRIPMVLGRPVNLSTIMSESNVTEADDKSLLLDLFGGLVDQKQ